MKALPFFALFCLMAATACKRDKDPLITATQPKLVFRFQFDSTQVRLNNLGEPATLPAGHEAQSPVFNGMSAHYVEMAPGDLTPLGAGSVLYRAPETTAGGSTAIDFSKAEIAGNGETFFSIPLKDVAPGSYKWLRVSLAYQNYNIRFKSGAYSGTGTLASFIGFNTYLQSYAIRHASVNVNGNRPQGYWGFEATIPGAGTYTVTGQAPAGSTTVVNPLFATSPIPAGSCLVTGQFVNASGAATNLVITGNETQDVVITVSLSTNKSFEWKEHSGDNLYEPAAGDTVVDMGVRGMIPFIQP